MTRPLRHNAFGFTLTEMAIVLAVVGVLAAGLWNIMSGANTQVRDESTASQQQQLISAVKSFLAGSAGANFMTNNAGCGGTCGITPATTKFSLPLPTNCAPPAFGGIYGGDLNLADPNAGFCAYLPPGFLSNTTNPYGQNYFIQILRDSVLVAQPPATYSIMILSTGGAAIPAITDTSGARISSLIGNDGGFVYTAPVCTPAASTIAACGSYGSWSVASILATFGFPGSALAPAPPYNGSIASRTYVSPDSILNNQYLARIPIPNDSPKFSQNAMTTPQYMALNGIYNSFVMGQYLNPVWPLKDQTNTFYMGDYDGTPKAVTGGTFDLQGGVINFTSAAPVAPGVTGTMNVLGGTINLGGGTITGNSISGNPQPINLSGSGGSPNLVNLLINGLGANGNSPPLNIITGCTRDQAAAFPGFVYDPPVPPGNPGCTAGMQLIADGSVAGQLTANSLFSQTFIYQTSDIRLKTNIHPIESSLTDVMRLKPVTFNFKAGGKKGLGVIAQDIEKIYPELVTENNGMKTVNYDGLIAPLISAVQELKHENDQLREQIRVQEVQQKQLESEINAGQ